MLETYAPRVKGIENYRTKRNAVICVLQLIFSTAFLIPLFVLAAPIFSSNDTFKAYDVETHNELRGIIATQILLYVFELFYRVKIRIEVAVHHILTIALFIFLNYVAAYSYAFEYATKMVAILILLAMLDQPKNIALFTRYIGFGTTKWWPMLCKIAAVWYIVSKLVVISISIFFMVESQNGNEASWSIPEHSFSKWMLDYDLNSGTVIGVVSTFIFLLLLDQIYTTYVLWMLAVKAENEEPLQDTQESKYTLGKSSENGESSGDNTGSDVEGSGGSSALESDVEGNGEPNQLA